MGIEIGEETKTFIIFKDSPVNERDIAGIDELLEKHENIYHCEHVTLSKELTYLITHGRALSPHQIRDIFKKETETIIQNAVKNVNKALIKLNMKLENINNG